MGKFELFDLGFEGTTVRDCLRFQKEKTNDVIFFDDNGIYGSTYSGYSGLKNSKYIKNCILNKGSGESKLLLEAFPAVFRPTDKHMPKLKETGMAEFLTLIEIKKHFYIDSSGKAHQIPYTRTEIADSDVLSLREKLLIGKTLRGGMAPNELYTLLSEKSREILINGIIGEDRDYLEKMYRYIRNFGNTPFLYPQYGFKEISEMFSRSNSMCGAGYVLDSALKVTGRTRESLGMFSPEENDGEEIPSEYMHRIDTTYGTIFTKRIIRAKNEKLTGYVRVINTRRPTLGKTFFALALRETLMKVIGLNSDTDCCPEGTYLIYIIKKDKPVDEEDLKLLHMEEKDIIEDISYQTKFSFESDSLDG
ncbi:RAB protein geranylgeranyltransferase subunit A [Encephalitozoon intestinalis ATCC 50506]|uniref:RAB protein geranylgeranyltransferase subunit A n=1 Tax=Encephalitozoon intestinalis (strain ATCC 50506) TaxID=876142 RepID=E0SA94_ENCIT|nr:RAB protein geranylgeranyltransferase subunit A [Encephalitozoon intestinalis ATCC 50506]ADM12519.1 RAB protein geranylgeranyltransferase subunit A [Encephalitozoon intestinalis ATCC 50506]UTX46372.1 RAB protein geranylgeranyltransferase subunit A [Encephalitozoon intestinalis]